MKTNSIVRQFSVALGSAILSSCLPIALAANVESRPDPREIPVPWIEGPLGRMPGPDELPLRPEMPDVLTMNDGTRVTSLAQWRKRREEMKVILQYYCTGQMPPAPGNVKGREISTELLMDGQVRYRLVRLTFGPDEKLGFDIGIWTPATGGPFPTIINQAGTPPGGNVLPRLARGPGRMGIDALLPVDEIKRQLAVKLAKAAADDIEDITAMRGRRGGWGSAEETARRFAEVFRRGYALVLFNHNDCAEDTTLRMPDGSWAFRTTRFFPAYPGYDWGIVAAWAWGISRIADHLETDPVIDGKKLIITGASRSGKAAMFAAAFDNRLMGAPVVSGGGGVGAFRYAGPRDSETLDLMMKKLPNWFSPNLHDFWGQGEKLPFDQHWFLALCAPTPFLALEGDTDRISLPEAVRQSVLHAKPAYALYDATDRIGVHFSHHSHAFTDEDWTALMNFADRHLRGKKDFTFDWFPNEAELDAAAADPGPGAGARAVQTVR